jgi:Cof subfamily protein (haloacid dehalogenase superfamily)
MGEIMNQIKHIVLFDMDDTLSDFKTGIIPESAYKAIELLKERGDTLVGMASGRGHFFFNEQRKDVVVDAFVCVNGQCTTVNNEIVYESYVKDEDLKKLIEVLTPMKGGLFAVNSFYGIKPILTVTHPDMEYSHSVTRLKDYGSNYSDEHKNHLLQAAFLPEFDQYFEKEFPHLSFHRYFDYMVDIYPKDTSKLTGIKAIANKYGLSLDDVITFGDGMNDLEMIQGVKFGIAMGNAQDRIKEVAYMITDSVNNNGVYNALCKLGLIKEKL